MEEDKTHRFPPEVRDHLQIISDGAKKFGLKGHNLTIADIARARMEAEAKEAAVKKPQDSR